MIVKVSLQDVAKIAYWMSQYERVMNSESVVGIPTDAVSAIEKIAQQTGKTFSEVASEIEAWRQSRFTELSYG